MQKNTEVIHAKQKLDKETGSHISPLYQTSTYVLPDFDEAVRLNQNIDQGFVYSRFGNPTVDEFEKKVAHLEQAEAALGTASGLGAISTAVLSLVKSGDHMIFGDVIYGCTFALFTKILPDFDVDYSIVDTTDVSAVRSAIKPNTKLIYIETPANPTLKISDIKEIAKLKNKGDSLHLIVDSTFASPYLQNPVVLGADLVVHSATKYLNGHGTVTAGVIAGKKSLVDRCRMPYMQCFGAVLDPFGAWTIMQGMKTLGVRMEKHCENAMEVATYLKNHPKVDNVYYPGLEDHPGHETAKEQMGGFGGMMSVDIKGGVEGVRRMLNNMNVFSLATSLGNVDSLIQHSPSMSHFDMTKEEREKVGIYEGQIRLSVGIEDVQDLIEDLEQGLRRV
ncbi:trans-sulfuration enzyme family protein [Isachenkonia alkalipeptolytica]|uniref:L-methionine gamma-lyase n=1 Tax=Isachenkonia alkalipeptolytica TaxID=2565777 RepID=A0AA44BEC1_9CLOT|nr:aminotransferase class I/II-fold pyridoxal phosphate-dependent enzyme [Isachenkonia alkalipeptolytica]NBG89159.1 aminotransferase class I/II-fold pyridoxal phosphate-dependent enzyme [Isachenkonia alkalipeptolytica]